MDILEKKVEQLNGSAGNLARTSILNVNALESEAIYIIREVAAQ